MSTYWPPELRAKGELERHKAHIEVTTGEHNVDLVEDIFQELMQKATD